MEPVYINIYDMTNHNDYTYAMGIGVFHSGVQVYGKEYSFGGHDCHLTGIFDIPPKFELPGTKLRESIKIGETNLSKRQVQHLIISMGLDYTGRSYNILSKNCNHFADDLLERLCGQKLPKWVNRLAYIGSFFSCMVPAMEFGPVPVQPACDEDLRPNSTNNNTRFQRINN